MKKLNRSISSYIEDFEEQEAKKFIEDELGFESIKAFSKKLVVKIFIRPEEISTFTTDSGKEVSIVIPEMYLANDKYTNFTALVLDVAKDCYTDDEYKETGPYCKVGDWIIIPRNVGTQQDYRGVTVQVIPENAIYCVVENPTYVERLYQGVS